MSWCIYDSATTLCVSPFRIYENVRLYIGTLSQDFYQRSPRVYGLRALELVEKQVADHHRNVSGRKRDTSAKGETQVVGRAQSSLEGSTRLRCGRVRVIEKTTMAPATDPAPDANISTSDALNYWNSISTTVGGMLGGYPEISRTDLKGSANI